MSRVTEKHKTEPVIRESAMCPVTKIIPTELIEITARVDGLMDSIK